MIKQTEENGTGKSSAETACYVRLPTTPTYELLNLLAQPLPEDWSVGKEMQMDLGCDVVHPSFEIETAAGLYKRLIDALI